MNTIYIGSTSGYAGKTLIALALALYFKEMGLRVGYMKPVGVVPYKYNGKMGDEDAHFVQQVLELKEDPELVTPVVVTRDLHIEVLKNGCPDFMKRILDAFSVLSREKDVMLISGSGSFLHAGKYCNVSGIEVARALDAKVILIDRFFKEFYYDYIVGAREMVGEDFLGCTLNSVPERAMEGLDSLLVPLLERREVKVIGVIPKDSTLNSIAVKDLSVRLKGNIIASQSVENVLVKDFLIGTMQVENFMRHFSSKENPAVIVGGDRSDLQLLALEGRCTCLILTGNIYPNEIILNRANELNIPIIMVRDDTYTVAKKMDKILETMKLRDGFKLKHGINLVRRCLNWEYMKKSLSL